MEATAPRVRRLVVPTAALLALVLLPLPFAAGEGEGTAYETPEALVEALVAAAEANNDDAIRALAGPENADVVQSGGDPSVARARAEFAQNAKVFRKLEEGEGGVRILVIGDARWPFPVPLVKTDAGWVLDVAAGREEMLARRVGRNELDAIKLCRGYLQVQDEYHSEDRDADGVREYAQHIVSTPGEHDGLYWDTEDGSEPSPMGPFVATMEDYLEDRVAGDPVGGYYWRILKGQGDDAPGGYYGYVINGNMIAGCALVGFPAAYGETGVMTFIVSHHGDVYQKDLGEATAEVVEAMTAFNPDETWSRVEEN